jgi:hypothetical protein
MEMARPATNGARTIRAHSASGKSLFVVTECLSPRAGTLTRE